MFWVDKLININYSNIEEFAKSSTYSKSHNGNNKTDLLLQLLGWQERTGGVKATFGPTIFSRNNYMSVTRSMWTTNLA